MITILNINNFNKTLDLCGLNTDAKPIDLYKFYSTYYKITNGSTFYELDTKKAFMFDEENKVWIEQ